MEILPLNYDKYFKKTFADTEIAQQFLEDFLNVEIAEITPQDLEVNLTNKSRELRFDFRCKNAEQHFIVEMQQWYKHDVVKRFFVYHCSNTVLQLEDMPKVKRQIFDRKTGKYIVKEEKDYSTLTPVITIIWFVDDSFRSSEDFIPFTILPEELKNFVNDESLWKHLLEQKVDDLNKLQEERAKLVKLLNKSDKNLDFLQENKMIYAFQPQIIKNKNNSRYYRWFDFAEKSGNADNKKADFTDYEDDAIFSKLLRLLSVEFVPESEVNEAEVFCDNHKAYVEQQNKTYEEALEQYRRQHEKENKRNKTIIKIKDQVIEERDKELEQKDQALINSARMMKSFGATAKQIQEVTRLSEEEINNLNP